MDQGRAIEGLELTAIISLLRQFKVPTLLLILLASNWKRIRSSLEPLMRRWYYQYLQRWVVDTFTDLEIAVEKRIWKTTFYNREADDKSFWKLCPWLPRGRFHISTQHLQIHEFCSENLNSEVELQSIGWIVDFGDFYQADHDRRVLSHLSRDELELASLEDAGSKVMFHSPSRFPKNIHQGMPALENHLKKQVDNIKKMYLFWPEKVPKCFLRHQIATVIESTVCDYTIAIALGLLRDTVTVIEIDDRGYVSSGGRTFTRDVIVIHTQKKHVENSKSKHIMKLVERDHLVVYLTPSLAKLSEVMPSGFYLYHLKIDGVTRGQLRKILEENQMEIDEDLIARLPDGVIPHSVLFRALATESLRSLIDHHCPAR